MEPWTVGKSHQWSPGGFTCVCIFACVIDEEQSDGDPQLSLPFSLSSVVDPHHVDADPDSTCHPDVYPDADQYSDFYLMRIRIPLFIFMRFRIQNLASK